MINIEHQGLSFSGPFGTITVYGLIGLSQGGRMWEYLYTGPDSPLAMSAIGLLKGAKDQAAQALLLLSRQLCKQQLKVSVTMFSRIIHLKILLHRNGAICTVQLQGGNEDHNQCSVLLCTKVRQCVGTISQKLPVSECTKPQSET